MLTVIKLLLSGTGLAGNIRAKYLAARRSATLIAILAVAGITLLMVGVLAIVMAVYFGLAPVVGDYQAALMIAAALIFGAAICAMVAVRKIKTVANAQHVAGHRAVGRPLAPDHVRHGSDQSMVESLTRSVQSPAVVSALVIGVLVGRRLMNKSDD